MPAGRFSISASHPVLAQVKRPPFVTDWLRSIPMARSPPRGTPMPVLQSVLWPSVAARSMPAGRLSISAPYPVLAQVKRPPFVTDWLRSIPMARSARGTPMPVLQSALWPSVVARSMPAGRFSISALHPVLAQVNCPPLATIWPRSALMARSPPRGTPMPVV